MTKKPTKSIKISPEIVEAAETIAAIKGEDMDDIVAKFYTDYVKNNLGLLTENAKHSIPDKVS